MLIVVWPPECVVGTTLSRCCWNSLRQMYVASSWVLVEVLIVFFFFNFIHMTDIQITPGFLLRRISSIHHRSFGRGRKLKIILGNIYENGEINPKCCHYMPLFRIAMENHNKIIMTLKIFQISYVKQIE